MTTSSDGTDVGPFGGETSGPGPSGDGPFGTSGGASPAAPAESGGLLDSLRDSGEDAVNQELAGLQAAMQAVTSFSASVGDADVDALRSEWEQIQSDLKRALQAGMSAVEDSRAKRHQVVVADEVKALETEVARKNALIAQLSDTIKDLNRELDEKERRLREELRGLRDRVAEQDDELTSLRARSTESEAKAARLRTELDAAAGERDEAARGFARVTEELEQERSHQEERNQALTAELNEARLATSKLENEKRDVERRHADLEKRLQVADKARTKAEGERELRAQEAAKAIQEQGATAERLAALELSSTEQAARIQEDSRKLRRLEGRLRVEGETVRSRVADARSAIAAALAALASVPPREEASDAAADAPADGPSDDES